MLFELYETYFNYKKDKLIKYFDKDKLSIDFSFEGEKYIANINTNDINIKTEYEILGSYNISSNMWTWSWANPFIEKNLTITSNNIKNIKNDIINFNGNDDEKELIYYYINNPSFFINIKNIDYFMKFMLYYSEGNWILQKNNINFESTIEFILIKNILNFY